MATLRSRITRERLKQLERVSFNLLLYVTEGKCSHMIDFESWHCQPGSLITVHAGQVQRFDNSDNWQGWLILFQPELLTPQNFNLTPIHDFCELPYHQALKKQEQQAFHEIFQRMYQDSQTTLPTNILQHLLRQQLNILLMRAIFSHACTKQISQAFSPSTQYLRFNHFKVAVERNLYCHYQVSDYAKLLCCSEKTLARTVQDVMGMTTKQYLTQRLLLEAKRLLCHTCLPVAEIAQKLGHDEPTNFIKFFRKEAGITPSRFRKDYIQESLSPPITTMLNEQRCYKKQA